MKKKKNIKVRSLIIPTGGCTDNRQWMVSYVCRCLNKSFMVLWFGLGSWLTSFFTTWTFCLGSLFSVWERVESIFNIQSQLQWHTEMHCRHHIVLFVQVFYCIHMRKFLFGCKTLPYRAQWGTMRVITVFFSEQNQTSVWVLYACLSMCAQKGGWVLMQYTMTSAQHKSGFIQSASCAQPYARPSGSNSGTVWTNEADWHLGLWWFFF